MMRSLLLFVITAWLAGCASSRLGQPIVDLKGIDRASYESDLAECREYAQQVSVAERAAAQSAGSAAVGALLGAAWEDREAAKRGAGTGAVLGAAKGTGRGLAERQRVVKNCLRGRGYRILN